MQKLVDLCVEYGDQFCIEFSYKKTKTMVFQKTKIDAIPIYIKGRPIEIVSSWRYLGFNLTCRKHFAFSAEPELLSFYRASNCIINCINKPSEEVLMKLLYSNCIPILSYGCDVKSFSSNEMCKINVAINDSIRKIVGWNRWESVRTLRISMGFKSIYEIFEIQKRRFLNHIPLVRNHVLNSILNL